MYKKLSFIITLLLVFAISGCASQKEKEQKDSFFTAVRNGDKKQVEKIISSKSSLVKAKSNGGVTPLIEASYLGQKDIAELLISWGADVNAKNNNGQTPLDVAKTEDIKALLHKHGGR